MEVELVTMCLILMAHVRPASAAGMSELIETLILAVQRRPWLLGVYVFAVGLPIILFISFMWPDKRFGPPNQPYYYKKSDDFQPDDPEQSPRGKLANTEGSLDSEGFLKVKTSSTHKRTLNKPKAKAKQ